MSQGMDRMNNPADRLEATGPDVVVIHDAPPEVINSSATPPRSDDLGLTESAQSSSRRRLMLITGLLALALIAALLVVFLPGDDEVATQPGNQTQPKAPAAQPAEPRITIEAPASVVAGQPAAFTVNYELPSGRFSGSIEEWGDGIGAGSAKQERCETTAQTSGPSSGRYSVSHTWAKAGTYEVTLGVNTYTCSGTTPSEAKASRTLTVTVLAP